MMKTAIVLVLALIAIPLAADECGTPYKTNVPGQVMMDVDFGGTIRGCRVMQTEGGVTADITDCEVPGRTNCTWVAQGVPGGPLPQSVTIELGGYHKTVECDITATGGLPVELLWVEVE